MVYGKYMCRANSSAFLIVVAPSVKAARQFARDNAGRLESVLLIDAGAYNAVREIEDAARAGNDHPEAIYVREDGSRDFERGAPVREREHWANHA